MAEKTNETAAPFDWSGATAEQRDEWVAEFVMAEEFCRCPKEKSGFSIHGHDWQGGPLIPVCGCWACHKPVLGRNNTTDAGDDYGVLRHVRETWLFSRRTIFTRHLHALLRNRPLGSEKPQATPDCLIEYIPGDYSHAAYLTLTSEPARAEA